MHFGNPFFCIDKKQKFDLDATLGKSGRNPFWRIHYRNRIDCFGTFEKILAQIEN
jgi:hypothetical protein